jgi:hypothetical protein
MIRRRLISVCVVALFSILVMGQDCFAQTDPCTPDPCQSIQNAVAGTCMEVGGSCSAAIDFSCSCDSGYAWQDATNTCEEPQPNCIDNDQDGYYAFDAVNCPQGDDCDDTNSDCTTNCTDCCGDGFVCGAEVCDDGNMDPCGTCDATCSTVQTLAPATGTINTFASSNLVDGETLTIGDGNNEATFEFDFDSFFQPGKFAVSLLGFDTAENVRDAVITAINSIDASLQVSASEGGYALVSLANDNQGSEGNVTLIATVLDAGFAVVGMSGGFGSGCPAGTGCMCGDDCKTGSCTGGICD